MTERDRRGDDRIPVGLYLEEIVDDEPHRCFGVNLSRGGIYMERQVDRFRRSSTEVQIVLPLPGEAESVWAKGEVIYDSFDALFHGTAVRFTYMPKADEQRLLRFLRRADRGVLGNPVGESGEPAVQVLRPGH